MDILKGLILGFLSGFFILYTLQPAKPYPEFMLRISERPWIFVLLLAFSWILFYYDQNIALMYILIMTTIIIDIEFLGRAKAESEAD